MTADHDEAEALGRLLDAVDTILRTNEIGVKIEPREFLRLREALDTYEDAAAALLKSTKKE